MIVMSRSSCLALFAIVAAGMLPMTAAHAQYYANAPQPPLYPYEVQRGQPYAVQVAPGTYVIQRPAEQPRNYPYVRCQNCGIRTPAAPKPGRFDRPHKPVDHALIEELRKRHGKSERTEQANNETAIRKPAGRGIINTTRIVRDPPVVRETRRYVDDPPRIIERRQVVDDDTGAVEPEQQPRRDDTKKRVIAADAEVTILGPDRMSIRLFRKGQGPKANAKAD
jgi:hypothetical protein